MADINQFTVNTVNIHQSKIDVVKFDGINNWKGKEDIEKFKIGNRQLKKSVCLLYRGRTLETYLSKAQAEEEAVKARGKSRTGGQYTGLWYFTDR